MAKHPFDLRQTCEPAVDGAADGMPRAITRRCALGAGLAAAAGVAGIFGCRPEGEVGPARRGPSGKGGLGDKPAPGAPADRPEPPDQVTTLAYGEEGGQAPPPRRCPPDQVTTLAYGEEGGRVGLFGR